MYGVRNVGKKLTRFWVLREGEDMIKEIVAIGRVSNRLGSVFTFKGLPEFYVEVVLEWDGKDFRFIPNHKPQEISDKEEYLNYGLFRGKSGSNIFILPSSFLVNITCDYSWLKGFEKQLETIKDEKKYKKIEKQYKIEFKRFKVDKDAFAKQINSGKKVLENFFEEFRKEKLSLCKDRVANLLEEQTFKTKKEKAEYKKVLTAKCQNKYKKGRSLRLLNYLQKISKLLLENSDKIIEIADGCKKYIVAQSDNKKIEKIPIILRLKNSSDEKNYFLYEKYSIFNIYEKIIFDNSAEKLMVNKEHQMGVCNIYNKEDKLFSPKSGFYYSYSLDKINVYPNLNKQETLNIFNLSRRAYIDFIIGRTFLEIHNNFYFMGINSYITATSLNDESLKEFQKDVKGSKSDLSGLLNLIDKNLLNRCDILLNFYFFEPTKTGNNIVEYIKDIVPSQLVQTIKLSNSLTEFYREKFNRDKFKFNWQQHIYNIYHKDTHKKFRTSLFRKIALGDEINLNRLMLIMNENMQYGINKKYTKGIKKGQYLYIPIIENLVFIDWLNKINKGEIKMSKDEKEEEFFVGKSYEERLQYFLENGNLVKNSSSMKMGVCLGLAIKILSWSIPNYGKKSLSFVGKKIERNGLNSVQVFVNEVFAKTKFHEYESLQSINTKLATQEMLYLDDNSFNKDEFIFGLFLGNELYSNVKSEKDPIPEDQEERGEDNE
jgi:hypothetical protein